MNNIHCFTSFSFSYLTRAIILARTLRARHPNWKIFATIVDEPPLGLDTEGALSDFDEVVYAKNLDISSFRSWIFKHDIVEACTAVKGHMLKRLLENGAEKVIYFDPDIAVFHTLDSIVERLESASIILTPHQVDANDTQGAVRDNELTSLRYGIFNLGFIAVRNDEIGHSFADWWSRQLYYACYDEVESGIFTDQKWCDLVPGLFDRVFVERDPGCNVASWNLSKRQITFTPLGEALVNGSPLKFYHYTKINAAGDLMTEKYAGNNVETIEVWNWYKRALKGVTIKNIKSGYWHYSTFTNGQKIPKDIRVLYRRRPDLMSAFSDPFLAEENSFYGWIRREMPSILEENKEGGFQPI